MMDQPDADPEELARSLGDLEGVNRWLGGRRSAVRHVLDLAGRLPHRPVTVLDVATGGADLPLALVRAADQRGLDLRVVATDSHPATLEFARRATAADARIEVALADALALPFENRRFDLVTCFTALHHFDRSGAVRVLRELERVAAFGVVVTDLARSWPALLGARALALTVWRDHPITRHDGPISVRAAFSPRELEELAREASTGPWRVRRHPLFRLSLVMDRTAPGAW